MSLIMYNYKWIIYRIKFGLVCTNLDQGSPKFIYLVIHLVSKYISFANKNTKIFLRSVPLDWSAELSKSSRKFASLVSEYFRKNFVYFSLQFGEFYISSMVSTYFKNRSEMQQSYYEMFSCIRASWWVT